MGEPIGHFAKQNKQDTGKQIPYDLSCIWNFFKKMNTKKQSRTILTRSFEVIGWDWSKGKKLYLHCISV